MQYFEMDCACKGKNLDKMLQPAILEILFNEPMHGFVIIQRLKDMPMFVGTEPDHAGVYRYLKKMEESGLLTSEWKSGEEGKKPKNIFSITEKGRDCLLNWMIVLKQYTLSIEKLTDRIEMTLRNVKK